MTALNQYEHLKLRDRFSREEISAAYSQTESYSKAAKKLTELGRGKVSRQLARHWIMNLDGSEVAEVVGRAQAVAKTRNQQISNNQLRKDVRSLVEYIENNETVVDAITDAVDQLNERGFELELATPPVSGKPMTVEILLSDLQIGKLAHNYNTSVAMARLFEYGRAAIFQINQKIEAGYKVERIVLGLLGDIIESDKKHKNSARATDTGTAEQMSNAIVGLFTLIVEPLARLGIPIEVVCVTGNHDHDDHGLVMYKPGLEQLSFPIYTALELITQRSGYRHVSYDIPQGSFATVDFYGQRALYEHGVGVAVNEASMKAHKVKRGEQLQHHLTYFRMGDKHNVSSFNAGQYLVNGAFFGDDETGSEYSSIAGFSGKPAQWIGFHVPRTDTRFTLYDSFVVQLGHIME